MLLLTATVSFEHLDEAVVQGDEYPENHVCVQARPDLFTGWPEPEPVEEPPPAGRNPGACWPPKTAEQIEALKRRLHSQPVIGEHGPELVVPNPKRQRVRK